MAEDSSFARLMESGGKEATGRATRRLRAGETVEGTVIQIAADSVFVDVGTPSDGRINRAEFEDKDGNLRVKVGDRIRATVVDTRPDGPQLAVSFGHGDKLDTAALDMARTSGTPIEGEITKVVKGGMEVSVGGVRAFCPASQFDLNHIADFTPFVGQKFEFRVIELRDNGRSVVLSRRSLLEERRKLAAAGAKERLIVGSEVEGTVQSLSRHGAVIDLEGVEGFIHLSELAPHRVERAEDVVKVGESVRVSVLSVEDGAKGLRVRLSLRALAPEAAAAANAPADEVLSGTVTRAAQNGVFVQTPLGEGLIPLRELGLAPGADHRRAYPTGKEIKVVVISRAGGKLAFSATQVARVEERKNYREFSGTGAPAQPAGASFGSLGDLLRGRFGAPAAATLAPVTTVARTTAAAPAVVPTPAVVPARATAETAPPAARPELGNPVRAAKGFTEGVIRGRQK